MDRETNEIMTIEEVAAFLRIPSSSVYKLAQEGKIPSLKVGRHWRFHRTTLNQWVIEQASLAKNRPEQSPE
jgi:excisionase family DNA binding protein